MRLNFRRFTVLRCLDRTSRHLVAGIIEIVEVVAGNVAIAVFDSLDLRGLAIFASSAILRCVDRPNCGFFAILIGDVEFIAGLAVFTCDRADLRRLTVLTIFAVNAVFTVSTLVNRDL